MAGLILPLLLAIFLIASIWKVFSKAGQPGWASIVPFYNIYIMTKIANKPAWWMAIILLVPIANIVFLIMLYNAIAQAFGKSSGFTVGMILLPYIFWPILGFGSAQYQGAKPANEDLLDDQL